MAEVGLPVADTLFTWVLVLQGTVLLAYAALFAKKPISLNVSAISALLWFGCIVMPLLVNPLPYLSWACAVGTAAAFVIAFSAEWPNTDNRPGPTP